MVVTASTHKITWELLPEDFILDDEPVDNVNQPSLAAALTESLQLAGNSQKQPSLRPIMVSVPQLMTKLW